MRDPAILFLIPGDRVHGDPHVVGTECGDEQRDPARFVLERAEGG